MTKKQLNEISYNVIGAAIEVHKSLGPGLLESVYHKCLSYELDLRGVYSTSEVLVPIYYKDLIIKSELRCDLFIENTLVVELKAVETM